MRSGRCPAGMETVRVATLARRHKSSAFRSASNVQTKTDRPPRGWVGRGTQAAAAGPSVRTALARQLGDRDSGVMIRAKFPQERRTASPASRSARQVGELARNTCNEGTMRRRSGKIFTLLHGQAKCQALFFYSLAPFFVNRTDAVEKDDRTSKTGASRDDEVCAGTPPCMHRAGQPGLQVSFHRTRKKGVRERKGAY
jgi:hypothetical protein